MPSETGPAHVHDYDFDLPPGLIAQIPPVERSGARMLTLERATGQVRDGQFLDLPEMLRPGDLLALNDSRVFPARLLGRRRGAAGHAEALLTTERAPGIWQALVRPGKKIPVGAILEFPHEGAPLLEAEVVEHGSFGERTLRFAPVADFFSVVERIGQVPLPPYIQRPGHVSTAEDRERYQTVYAGQRGSVAAPTAGLHFTPEVLTAIRARGVELAWVTLHVGPGTFQPVRVDTVADIRLHSERYTLSTETAEAVNRARSEGRRIVAVGTTTVRTLEACALRAAAPDAPLTPHSGETDIFIAPGHSFRVVQAMLTNFHLPQSTLLMLVCAFAGYAPVMAAYRHAVAAGYRFFSYGDCMFIG